MMHDSIIQKTTHREHAIDERSRWVTSATNIYWASGIEIQLDDSFLIVLV